MTDAILESPEAEAGAVAKHPIGRLARPEDIAEAVVYLLSSRASFMSGSTMVVDGGYSAQ
jgi:NAD(P)-dependent dehydrogenase (short-subunit alcohol dehydrogenase family)